MDYSKNFMAEKVYELPLSVLEKLTFHPFNRKIIKANVERLIKSMERDFRRFHAGSVLQVGLNTGNILDGQHRREAFVRLMKKGKLPEGSTLKAMFLDIAPEDELEYIGDINTDLTPWRGNTHVDTGAAAGNPVYKALQKLCSEFPQLYSGKKGNSYRRALAALTGHSYTVEKVRKGQVTMEDCDYDLAVKVSSELGEILKLFNKRPSALEQVIKQWHERRKKFTFKQWTEGFKARKNYIVKNELPLENGKDWVEVFDLVEGHIAHTERTRG